MEIWCPKATTASDSNRHAIHICVWHYAQLSVLSAFKLVQQVKRPYTLVTRLYTLVTRLYTLSNLDAESTEAERIGIAQSQHQ